MKKRIFLAIFVIFISGCATTYHSKSFTGGFSETQLGENIFLVSFKGDGFTHKDSTIDFTLLRSAEITMENGFKYFVIFESDDENTYSAQTYDEPIGLRLISKPSATNKILCFKEKPETKDIVYEAKFVAKSIRNKYGITD